MADSGTPPPLSIAAAGLTFWPVARLYAENANRNQIIHSAFVVLH